MPHFGLLWPMAQKPNYHSPQLSKYITRLILIKTFQNEAKTELVHYIVSALQPCQEPSESFCCCFHLRASIQENILAFFKHQFFGNALLPKISISVSYLSTAITSLINKLMHFFFDQCNLGFVMKSFLKGPLTWYNIY